MNGLREAWEWLNDDRARQIGQALALVFGPLLVTIFGSRRPRHDSDPPVVSAKPTPEFAAYIEQLFVATRDIGAATGRLERLENTVERIDERLGRLEQVSVDTNVNAHEAKHNAAGVAMALRGIPTATAEKVIEKTAKAIQDAAHDDE